MENILKEPLPEIVFGSSEPAASQGIRRAIHAGKLRKIAPRIYTSNLIVRWHCGRSLFNTG